MPQIKNTFLVIVFTVIFAQALTVAKCAAYDNNIKDDAGNQTATSGAENSESDPYNPSVKSAYGVRFYAPQDMPIIKKGGVITPVDTYEYIGVEVSKLDKRIKNLEDDIAEMKAELEALKNNSGAK